MDDAELYAAVLAERYAPSRWWSARPAPRPELDDSEVTTARRRLELEASSRQCGTSSRLERRLGA